mmetsp:Transcript_43601/g.145281  ORF Transcript_43601/g.145281 Transcript_43601/m.145281 type:complete len:176 (+) Transcript_43601:793-1320(+)
MESGASLTAEDGEGKTPQHVAAEAGHSALASKLAPPPPSPPPRHSPPPSSPPPTPPLPPPCSSVAAAAWRCWPKLLPSPPAADLGSDGRLPPQFICPISAEVMLEPVTTCDGHTFERSEIERWFATYSAVHPKAPSAPSPLTGAMLPTTGLAHLTPWREGLGAVHDGVSSRPPEM